MIRTQISLSAAQHEQLRRMASECGVSMAQLVREGVERLLEADERRGGWQRFLAATDWFKGSGLGDYVAVESVALAHGRLGPAQVRELRDNALRSIGIRWVDAALHERALAALGVAARRRPSFVDWVSFELMRRDGIQTAFVFDRDLAFQGFATVP